MRKNLWTLPRQWARSHPDWLREHAGLDLADPLVVEALSAEMGRAEAALAIRAAEWRQEYGLWRSLLVRRRSDGALMPAIAGQKTLEKLHVLCGIEGDPADAFRRGEARRTALREAFDAAGEAREKALALRELRLLRMRLCRLAGWPLAAIRTVCVRDGEPDADQRQEIFRQAEGHCRGWRAYAWHAKKYPTAKAVAESVGQYSSRCSYRKYERSLRGGWWQMTWDGQTILGAGNRVTLPDGRVFRVGSWIDSKTARRKFSAPELVEIREAVAHA